MGLRFACRRCIGLGAQFRGGRKLGLGFDVALGLLGGTIIFMLPGSENAVRLALTKLILPELGHVVRELRR